MLMLVAAGLPPPPRWTREAPSAKAVRPADCGIAVCGNELAGNHEDCGTTLTRNLNLLRVLRAGAQRLRG
jgi:hypothetical protein